MNSSLILIVPSYGLGLVYGKELSLNLVRYAANDSTLWTLSRRCPSNPQLRFNCGRSNIDMFLADRQNGAYASRRCLASQAPGCNALIAPTASCLFPESLDLTGSPLLVQRALTGREKALDSNGGTHNHSHSKSTRV